MNMGKIEKVNKYTKLKEDRIWTCRPIDIYDVMKEDTSVTQISQ
jgi:hypothetical protein